MAAVLTATASRTHVPVVISGTGFDTDGEVTVSISGTGMQLTVPTDGSGDWNLGDVLAWAPLKVGKHTVVADDGTTVKTATITIYTTT